MDPLTQIRLTREFVDIESTTRHEGSAGVWLAALLRRLGYRVVEQPVSEGRFNVIATIDSSPQVVFSTHFDCVPPFFSSREEGGRLHGRGACDAKGIAMAQVAAVERLRQSGETRAGLLFVVGEERDSDGASRANTIAPASRFLINGEPTGNRLATATRGLYRVRLRAHGLAAHSSHPEVGVSAIEKLVDAIVALRAVTWPVDPVLGATYYTVGLIAGGVAHNVVPAEATADVLFRTVGDHRILGEMVTRAVGDLANKEDVFVVPLVPLKTVSGFETATFNFTTDIPFLSNWGEPLLLGPGSIQLAHTADEYVEIAELHRAVDLYVDLARQLLG